MKLCLWSVVAALVVAAADASTLTPPVLPLIVRNPYLSIWLPQARDAPWKNWPMFWRGSTVGFAIMASVPHSRTVYPLLGRPHDFLDRHSSRYNVTLPQYDGATFDASTTNLSYAIPDSDIKITLSFLSPITPTSTTRQALPASYLTCFVEGSVDVSLYVDVNGEWVSGSRGSKIQWQFGQSEAHKEETPLKTWRVTRADEQLFTEVSDRAEWGTFHISAPSDAKHQSGEARNIRRMFAESSSLRNEIDDSYRGIFEEEPIFAFSKKFKLGNNSTSSGHQRHDSIVFTFVLTQDPVVQFASARGLTLMRPLWASHFFTTEAMIRFHYNDYDTAAQLAREYSSQLATDAYASGSKDYQDIVALSARQVLGATQFAGTPGSPIIFLKEISSNGNFQTVDVIFPAFPFFLYTNPKWLAYLLEPLLEHQLSGQYPNDYSMHDLGSHFPNATGHSDGRDEYMPVEECGNMLIMALALANALRDDTQPAFTPHAPRWTRPLGPSPEKRPSTIDSNGMDRTYHDIGITGEEAAATWLRRSYKLWKQWTGYLIRESLVPAFQLSTDDFAGRLANQTNLALKGIVGIKAMSSIAEMVGNETDAKYYRGIADAYIDKWQEYALSRDKTHVKLAYTWWGSWTTLYNLYADALLCFHLPNENSATYQRGEFQGSQQILASDEHRSNSKLKKFIPDKIYQMQSDWYHNVLQRYGLPLDSRHIYTKSDWEFFAAAVASKKVRTEILQHVATWVNETATDKPLTDLYDTEGKGGFPDIYFMARPVVGGHFAFLALERACKGKASEGLEFLDSTAPAEINVQQALAADMIESQPEGVGEL
ncbi:putative glutaminase A [Rosellinia necatrix]|uniref:Putative glutaminase A n=1 Tax=Rosellinia necatrix TaxID=77044 RepID=A0A1W2TQR0_ROSNE|nr:putative glutaminase A [Rosellinia necatrix]